MRMREIKFRAWNKEKEIMVYGNEDDSECSWDGVIASDVDMVNSRLRYTLVSEYIWMQYAGSMHGKGEIYEMDIVEYGTFKNIGVICYDTHQAMFKIVPVQFYLANAGHGGWTGHPLRKTVPMEVIGDVYRNPELLEAAE
ncbi:MULTISPECIES: YopX family protein [Bacillus]|uniref:YopX family protein n=1 Tax=Bacillus TaxID=1386 RepID=UPI0030F61990